MESQHQPLSGPICWQLANAPDPFQCQIDWLSADENCLNDVGRQECQWQASGINA
ncbi:MAG: hypothetical protein GY948_12755 [Alphaproteobacteria bacterium]|nr:hypothetical protein [Alphaproteobacteria bacterium]